jgi:hypothetical protein
MSYYTTFADEILVEKCVLFRAQSQETESDSVRKQLQRGMKCALQGEGAAHVFSTESVKDSLHTYTVSLYIYASAAAYTASRVYLCRAKVNQTR